MILLYFIRVLLSAPKTFLLFLVFLVGGGWTAFWLFKSLDNNMGYSSSIAVEVYMGGYVQKRFCYRFNIFRCGLPGPP